VVALLVVLIMVGARRERERQQRIRQWAAHHGWTITERILGRHTDPVWAVARRLSHSQEAPDLE